MFINDVHKKEEIRNIAIQHLRKFGIKFRPKKPRVSTQVPRYGKRFFKVPLPSLETQTVTLTNGQQLLVPKRVNEMCSFILSKVQTEGLFRKEGSKSRQHEIKLSLDQGCLLGEEHHVIDVAVVLKCFLRELPEPLIPPAFNDLFLMCSLEKRPRENVLECLLLACLLLPSENLNVLSYLMQFFHEVASFSTYNKMGVSNLSIILGPNVFPMDDKPAPKSSLTVKRICDITRLLIENSLSIGVIPDNIIDQIGQLSDMEGDKRRKNKRRSGSLTRMLNGLKKIVNIKNDEDSASSYVVTPDLLLTRTEVYNKDALVKKKKGEQSGLSLKKKKEVLNKLPDCAVLNTPFTPSRTPVSVNPNGKKAGVDEAEGVDSTKEKKMHWYMRSRSMKSLKEDESSIASNNSRRNSLGPKSLLERRWSAVSNAANFRKKKRNPEKANNNAKGDEPDYVRVSKTEYEDFKNRVSAIERRISLELDNVVQSSHNSESVQTVYEKTLETGGSLSPTTDQLARRLSRDLRIRRSAEQKSIRSPSARKIGTIRRRSTEREKKNAAAQVVMRNQSWHLGQIHAPLLPRVSVRRKKGKEDLSPQVIGNSLTISPCAFAIGPQSSASDLLNSEEHWTSAKGFFSASVTTPQEVLSGNARASIAKLRSQNIGMVRAKAKLFDNLKDSPNTSNSSSNKSCSSKTNYSSGIKSTSGESVRMSYRIKALKAEERRNKKSMSISPKRRPANKSQKQKLQYMARQYADDIDNNSLMSTPRRGLPSPKRTPRAHMPHIKGQLTVKTPKRLCRTPAVEKRTPFKAVATPL